MHACISEHRAASMLACPLQAEAVIAVLEGKEEDEKVLIF